MCTVSAPIERRRSIKFWHLQTGVLFELGQSGALIKLALYLGPDKQTPWLNSIYLMILDTRVHSHYFISIYI